MTPVDVTFSKSESCIMQVQRSKSTFLLRGVCSPLDGVIGRRESSAELGPRGAKRQTSARSANARQRPAWPIYYQLVDYSFPFTVSPLAVLRLGSIDVIRLSRQKMLLWLCGFKFAFSSRNQWLQNKRNMAPQRTFPVTWSYAELHATLSRAFSKLCEISSSWSGSDFVSLYSSCCLFSLFFSKHFALLVWFYLGRLL